MGVPVVGLKGSNIHQRVCSAILNHAGYPEWIAETDEEYIEIALKLAADKEKRKHLRKNLRSKLKSSLLCDEKQFAVDFARAIEGIHKHQKTDQI